MARPHIDETGKRYGAWTIIGVQEHRYETKDGHAGGWFKWIAECACGYRTEAEIASLRAGKSKSCFNCGRKASIASVAAAREAKFQKLARFAP